MIKRCEILKMNYWGKTLTLYEEDIMQWGVYQLNAFTKTLKLNTFCHPYKYDAYDCKTFLLYTSWDTSYAFLAAATITWAYWRNILLWIRQLLEPLLH